MFTDRPNKLNNKQTEIDRLNGIGNATSSQILKGYTALVKGKTITGTIESKGETTYTPGTENQTIASGKYLSETQIIKGDANLVAGNIKSGTRIFGVDGTYTSDATAAKEHILSGKTAYVNGNKVTGTMPNRNGSSESTLVSTGANGLYMVFPYGYYPAESHFGKSDSSEVYIANDKVASAIGLTAAKIAKGQTIIGVSGTYTSDATAAKENILSGKTAYVNGSKVTGTMVDRGLAQYGTFACAPSGCGSGSESYYAINAMPEGWYHSDGNSWAPEARVSASSLRSALGITANKIAVGQSIAGVTGTYMGTHQLTYLATIGYSSTWNDAKSWTASEKSVVMVIAYCNISVTVNGVAKGSSGGWAHQNAGGIFHFTMNAGETLTISGSGGGGQGAIAYRVG